MSELREICARRVSWRHGRGLTQLKMGAQASPALFLKALYLLDFLDLSDGLTEKDLENAILAELKRFILELGSDFAFMGRQKRIQVGGTTT